MSYALADAAGALAGHPRKQVRSLARRVTASNERRLIARGYTGLNHDGTALQLCISADASGVRYRLLGDPASDVRDPSVRFARSLTALEAVLHAGGATSLRALLDQTLACAVGTGSGFVPHKHPDGVLWLGAPVGGQGVAVYVDARDGGDAPLERLERWFATVATPSRDGAALLGAVRDGRIMCLGIEGVSPVRARAKVYWRLARPAPLAALPIALFAHPAFARFAELVIADREIRLDAVVLSAGLAIPSGDLVDAKMDICCCPHCVALDGARSAELLERLAREFGAPLPALREVLEVAELAFLGIGLDRASSPRINVYLKPKLPPANGDDERG